MELTWLMRIRIAAAITVGIVLLGIIAWPFVSPMVPRGAITLHSGDISIADALICIVLAFASGFIAYFASWPFGSDLAPLAAPAGIALWTFRSGQMSSLLRINTDLTVNETVQKRQALYAVLKWESLFWLALVAAGFFGAKLAEKLLKAKKPVDDKEIGNTNKFNLISAITAIVLTVAITQFTMTVFAQDVQMHDSEIGSVVGQPGNGQIAFALLLSFGIAAFVAKKILDASYIFPAIAACGLAFYAVWMAAKPDVLQHMIETWPEVFYSRSTNAILPIQIVAFGAIGSVAGYWSAIKFAYWRKHGE